MFLLKLQKGITSAFEFINNFNILTYSKTIEENCKALKRAYKVCIAWARQHRIMFAHKKYYFIYFTKSYKKFNIKVTVNINGFIKGLVNNLCILGVQVNLKLKWGPHINIVKTKMVT